MDEPQNRFWMVEVWRGIAALMVAWVHWGPSLGWPMGPMAFGFTGVDVFFVLSGFVFAPTVLAGRAPALVPYAVRRVARIYPAYLLALALYAWLVWRSGQPLLFLPEHLLMAQMQSREVAFYYNPVFWSLPSEVAFYALTPLIAWWLGDAQQARWRWPLLFGLALALRLAMVRPADGGSQNWAYIGLHHLPGLLIEFFMGVWVWQLHQQRLAGRARWLHPGIQAVLALLGWLLLAQLFVAMTAWSAPEHDWRHGQIALAAAACFAWLLDACMACPVPRGRLAWLGRWAGQLSYGVYLLHTAWLVPAQVWSARWGGVAGGLLAGAGLLGSCWLLHCWVEAPGQRAGRALSQRWAAAQKTSVSPG